MQRAGVALLLLVAPGALGGQEASILTEEELLAAVGRDHPAAVALARERDLAAAEVVRAALLPNPAVEATREKRDHDARESSASLTWVPPIDGRRALRRAAADQGLTAAEGRFASALLQLRREVRGAYAAWAFAWQRRELLAGQLSRVRELAERARARADAGEIAGLAARRFALEEAQARADLARAEATLATARAVVAAWYPQLGDGAVPAVPALPPAPEAAARVATAAKIADRPDVAAAAREVERAETLERLSRRIVEAPAVGLGWKRVEDGPAVSSGPVFSVAWTVPLLDRRQAERGAAQAELSAARADLAVAQARARAGLSVAHVAYAGLRAAAEDARRAAAGVERILAAATAAYQLGESGATDLLDALRAALGIRVTAFDAEEAALASHRDLEIAWGRPLTADGGLP